jgi:hypothetical protein
LVWYGTYNTSPYASSLAPSDGNKNNFFGPYAIAVLAVGNKLLLCLALEEVLLTDHYVTIVDAQEIK